jgi:hypothetical protein
MNKFAYGLPKDLYNGMRVRPTMDTIADSIGNDPYRIKYPNREATFYMNSPQFLSLLQDTNVGLDEQSKRLEQQKMVHSRARLGGEGGAVGAARVRTGSFETASSGEESVDMTSPQTLARMNLQARVRRRLAEVERDARERREQEERDYEYAQFLRRQQEEERRIAQEIARATAASSSSHPTASSSALATASRAQFPADLGGATLTPEQIRRLFAAMSGDPQLDIKYFTPPTSQQARDVRQGIVPQPPNYFTTTPFRLPADVMSDAPPGGMQTKRPSTELSLPIAKAKGARVDSGAQGATATAGPVIEEVAESPRKATSPVKKTVTKDAKTQELEDQLSEELMQFSRDIIRAEFTKRFPTITKVADDAGNLQYVGRSNKGSIAKAWILQVGKKGNVALSAEAKQLKEQRERFSRATSSAAAQYPPVGRGS